MAAMADIEDPTTRRDWLHSPYTWLLAVLTSLLLLQPVLRAGSIASALSSLIFSLLLVTAVVSTNHRKIILVPSLILAAAGLGFRWWDWVAPANTTAVLSLLPSAALLFIVCGSICVDLARQRQVTTDTLSGGVCVYLLLGITWALLMGVLEILAPGSFRGPEGLLANPATEGDLWFGQYLYFSFVTLTTLGYGDIAPVTRFGQLVAVSEAVVGQLYIAIFVARLVGLYTAMSVQRGD